VQIIGNLGHSAILFCPKTYFHGTHPLHEAAFLGRADLVELLISLGAKQTARNDKNESAADIARHRGHTRIVEILERT
jgi:ankyrin repeat protein